MNLLKIESKVCRQDSVLQYLDSRTIILWGQPLEYIVSLKRKITSVTLHIQPFGGPFGGPFASYVV